MAACLWLSPMLGHAQTPPTIYARVIYGKVEGINVQAYLKLMKENVKPALQQATQNGTLSAWYFYSIGYTGAESPYNFASVLIYDSWAKTERLPDLEDLMKKSNPKVDAIATAAKLSSIRKMVKQEFYEQLDNVNAPDNAVPKYTMISYMKSTPGLTSAYIEEEKSIWKPIHQEFVKSGQTAGWGFWGLIMPSGTEQPFDFVTANQYLDYGKLNSTNYAEAMKKVYPTRSTDNLGSQTQRTRSIVRSELWELVDYISYQPNPK
jgi:hypothetical protein